MESIIFPNPQLFWKTDFPAGYIILHVYIYIHIYIYTHPIKRRISPLNLHHHLSWGFHPPTPPGAVVSRRNAPAPWAQRTACQVRKTSIEPRLQGGRSCWWNWWWLCGWESLPQMPEEFTFFRNLFGASNLPRYIQMKGVFQRILEPVVRSGCSQKRCHCYFHPDFWGDDPIWPAYFSNGLKSPTSLVSYCHDWLLYCCQSRCREKCFPNQDALGFLQKPGWPFSTKQLLEG